MSICIITDKADSWSTRSTVRPLVGGVGADLDSTIVDRGVAILQSRISIDILCVTICRIVPAVEVEFVKQDVRPVVVDQFIRASSWCSIATEVSTARGTLRVYGWKERQESGDARPRKEWRGPHLDTERFVNALNDRADRERSGVRESEGIT